MPIKHGSSHGLSVLGCTIIAAWIVELLKPLMPKVYQEVEKFSMHIKNILPVSFSVDFVTIILIASVLAILWGIFFKIRFVRNNF